MNRLMMMMMMMMIEDGGHDCTTDPRDLPAFGFS
jgi:hypothetical protein